MSGEYKHLQSAALSDVGRKRKNNEDAVLVMDEYGVLCVADGMGGAEAGEVASKASIDHVRKALEDSRSMMSIPLARKNAFLRHTIEQANRWVWRFSVEKGLKSCGTTIVLIMFDPARKHRALVLHVGDSRAYRLRNGSIQQLTRDHSFAAATGVTDESLLPPRFRSVITRAVGIADEVSIEETPVDTASGDCFILCSDGLSRMLPDNRIRDIVFEHLHEDASSISAALVKAANDAGGLDNVSVTVTKVGDIGIPADGPSPDDTVEPATAGDSDSMEFPPDITITRTDSGTGIPGEWTPRVGMTFRTRIFLGLLIILMFIGIIVAIEWYMRKNGLTARHTLPVPRESSESAGNGWEEPGAGKVRNDIEDLDIKPRGEAGPDDLRDSSTETPAGEPAKD